MEHEECKEELLCLRLELFNADAKAMEEGRLRYVVEDRQNQDAAYPTDNATTNRLENAVARAGGTPCLPWLRQP